MHTTTLQKEKKKSGLIARFESGKMMSSTEGVKITKKSVFEQAMEDLYNGDVYDMDDLTLLMAQRGIILSN